jgi:hypothetical protein
VLCRDAQPNSCDLVKPSPPAALEFRAGRRGGAAGAIGVDRDKR